MSVAFRERVSARLEAAGVGAVLSATQWDQLNRYYEVLNRWNRKMNLTALPLDGLPDQTIDRLFVEPLVAQKFVQDIAIPWIDVGSGGGSPAIPLKIARPRAALTMVEARERKASFLREAARALRLKDVTVITHRLGAGPLDGPNLFELATLRAVSPGVFPALQPLLSPSVSILWFGLGLADLPPEYALDQVAVLPGGSRLVRLKRS